jgi:hypothetical protein
MKKREPFFAQGEQGFDRPEQPKPKEDRDTPVETKKKESELEGPDGPTPWQTQDR